MKKIAIALAFCAIFAACHNQNRQTTAAGETSMEALGTSVYEGTIPSADGPGIRCTLLLNGDSTFVLSQNYLEAEDGKEQTFEYTGKVGKLTRTVDGKQVQALCLPLNESDALYFVQKTDSTLRMVSKDMEEAVNGAADYDLKLVRQ